MVNEDSEFEVSSDEATIKMEESKFLNTTTFIIKQISTHFDSKCADLQSSIIISKGCSYIS